MTPLWTELAAAAGVPLTDAQTARLDQYLDLLIAKNEVLNLTRITDRPAAEIKHVADALTLLPYLPPEQTWQGRRRGTLVDVGAGGGVVGVCLAIARPDLDVLLVDATRKKLDAVVEMCAAIGLTNVQVHHGRAEEMRHPFDVVTARGVAELRKLVGWCRGLMGPVSSLLALKGPKAAEEIEAAAGALRAMKMTATPHAVAAEALAGHVVVVVQRLRKSA